MIPAEIVPFEIRFPDEKKSNVEYIAELEILALACSWTAPGAEPADGATDTVATPSEPVNAVLLPNAANPDPRLKVTSRPTAGLPDASIRVALALKLPPAVMVVTGLRPE